MRRILWILLLLLIVALAGIQVTKRIPSLSPLSRQTVASPQSPLPTLATSNLMSTARITISPDGRWLAVLCRGYQEIAQGGEHGATLTVSADRGGKEYSTSFRHAYFRLAAHILREGYPFVHYAFSPGKNMIATFGGDDKRVAVWDTRTGRLLAVWREHSSPVTTVVFSDHGGLVVTGTEGGGAYVWSREKGELLCRVRAHRGKVTALAMTADGKLLATAGDDASLRVWKVQTGRLLWRSPRLQKPVVALAFSPAGDLLLSSTEDGDSVLWETSRGEEKERVEWRFGVKGRVQSVGFSEDGKQIQIAQEQEYICLWNLGESRLQGVIEKVRSPVHSMTFTPDGKYLFVGDEEGNIHIWQTTSTEKEAVIRTGRAPVTALATSPDGESLLAGTADGKVLRWDRNKKRQAPLRLAPYVGRVQYVAFTGEDQRFISASADGEVVLHDIQGTEIARVNNYGELQIAALSSDGTLLATQRSEGIAVWKLSDHHIQPVFELRSSVLAQTLGFSPDNSRLYVVACGQIDIYRVSDGQREHRRTPGDFCSHCALSPDGSIIAHGENGTIVKLFSWQDGRLIARLEYAGDDTGWIIASGDGYYTCPEQAKSHVAWDVGNRIERNTGRDLLAYYRPDAVHRALQKVYETRPQEVVAPTEGK
ncbi:MAG: hypothetical protein KatS3mg023_0270 [Armatimonadota bacterium]|nr:MAG: hypothetical protein KatS3mg023_0270 [Armatimonadota bacterium]